MNFLNRAASAVINRLLGDYIDNVNMDNVSFSLSGELTLHNLQLKGSALDKLGLPLKVRSGTLSKLYLQVPLRSSTPAIVNIEGLYILAGPSSRSAEDYNEKEEREAELLSKQRKLAVAESYKEARRPSSSKDDKNDDSFLQRLLNSVLATLQVRIKSVHVRYEDPGLGTPEQQSRLSSFHYSAPFCAGISVESLEAQSTDSQWNISSTSGSLVEKLLYKLIEMNSLSLYVDACDTPLLDACGLAGTNTSAFSPADFATFQKQMASSMTLRCDGGKHNYILQPTGAFLKITLNNDRRNFEFPRVQALLQLQRVELSVRPVQYHNIMFVLGRLENAALSKPYLKWKPKERPDVAPKLWWKFVLKSVLDPIQQRNARLSPQAFTIRRQQREQYVPIYIKNVKQSSLSSAEKKSIQDLENVLSFEDIMYFRALAEIQARAERTGASNPAPSTPGASPSSQPSTPADSSNSSSGWRGWFGSFIRAPSTTAASSDGSSGTREQDSIWSSIKFTDEEQEAFLDVVHFERSASYEKTRSPPDYEKYVFSWSSEAGQLTLLDTNSTPLLSFDFDRLNLIGVHKRAQTSVQLSLASLHLTDHISPNTLFPQVLSPQKISSEDLLRLNVVYSSSNREPKPEADIELSLSLRRLNLVLNVDLAQSVTQAYLSQILASSTHSSSANSAEGATKTASYWNNWAQSEKRNAQLLSLASMKKSVHIDINLEAPNIIIPERCDVESSPVIAFGLGTFRILTISQPAENMFKLPGSTLPSSQLELKSDFYTTHQMSVSDVHAIVTTSERYQSSKDLNSFTEEEQLISPISAMVAIAACKIDSATLPKLRVASNVSPIHMYLTSSQANTAAKIAYQLADKASSLLRQKGTQQLELTSTNSPSLALPPATQHPVAMKPANWTQAMSYTEVLVKAANPEDHSAEVGLGIVFDSVVSEVKASLVLLNPSQTSHEIASSLVFTLKSFNYALETRKHSIQFYASLGSLHVLSSQPSQSTASITLADSQILSLGANPEQKDQLISVQLIHRSSEDELYAHIDNDCSIQFLALSIALHTPSLRHLMTYVRGIVDTVSAAAPILTHIAPPSSDSPSPCLRELPNSSTATDQQGQQVTEFRLKVTCRAVQVLFFDLDCAPLSEFTLQQAEASFKVVKNTGWQFDVVVGGLSVVDSCLLPSDPDANSRRHLIAVEDTQPVKFNLTSILPPKSSLTANFPSGKIPSLIHANVDLNKMRLLLNPKWIFNMLLSISDLSQTFSTRDNKDALQLPPKSASPSSFASALPSPTTPSFVTYSVSVSHIRVFMPEELNSLSFVVADIGSVAVEGQTRELPSLPTSLNLSDSTSIPEKLSYCETISVSLRQFNAYTSLLNMELSASSIDSSAVSSSRSPLIADAQLDVTLSSSFSSDNISFKDNKITTVRAPLLRVLLAPEKARTLFLAIQNNVFYMPTELEVLRRVEQATMAENAALLKNPQLYNDATTKPEEQATVATTYDIALEHVILELNDFTSQGPENRLIELDVSGLRSSVEMLSDSSMRIEFLGNKLSAIDLRSISTLPPRHPLYGKPELDTKDQRMFIFPTEGAEPQLTGSFSTIPSKNQMSTVVTLRDFQLLPEATITQRLIKIIDPISKGALEMLARREAITTLTMAPMQKANFLRLKKHPETGATYKVTLHRPEIILASSLQTGGLRFAATAPASIGLNYSQTSQFTMTEITISELAASYGATNLSERNELFNIAKPRSNPNEEDLRPIFYHYDILSPLSLRSTIIISQAEQQYAVQFGSPLRMTSSFADYLDVLELLSPFLESDDNAQTTSSAVNLGFDATPMKAYQPDAGNPTSEEFLSSLLGGNLMSSHLSTSLPRKMDDDDLVDFTPLEAPAEDDIYSRLMDSQVHIDDTPPKAAYDSENCLTISLPSELLKPPSAQVPTAGSMPTRRATILDVPPSLSASSSREISASSPSALKSSGNDLIVKVPRYVMKRLNVSALDMEVMVMDNQQSDLGLLRMQLNMDTIRLHNWDADAYRNSLNNTQQLAYCNACGPLPKRLAELELKIEAECFAPMVSAWEPLIAPLEMQLQIEHRDIRFLIPKPVDFIFSENLITTYRRIISALDQKKNEDRDDIRLSKSNPAVGSSSSNLSSNAVMRSRGSHLYYISNCTGRPFTYFLVQEGGTDFTSPRVLESGAEEPILVPMDWHSGGPGRGGPAMKVDRSQLAKKRAHFTISADFSGTSFAPSKLALGSNQAVSLPPNIIQGISVNTIGCRVSKLDTGTPIVVDVQHKQGAKVLTFKSRVSIHNNTAVPLIVGMETALASSTSSNRLTAEKRETSSPSRSSVIGSSQKPSPTSGSTVIISGGKVATVTYLRTVEPFGWYHVPIELVADGVVFFRPATTSEFFGLEQPPNSPRSPERNVVADTQLAYQWGDYRCVLSSLMARPPFYLTCHPRDMNDLAGSSNSSTMMMSPFQYSVGICRVATKSSIVAGSDELVLYLQPPLVLENLLPRSVEYLVHEGAPISQSTQKGKSPKPQQHSSSDNLETTALPTVGSIGSGQRIALHSLSTIRPILLGLSMEGYSWSPEALIRGPEPRGPIYTADADLAQKMREDAGLNDALDLPEAKPTGKSAASSTVDSTPRYTRIILENQVTEYGTRLVSFYVKYWIVNKTGAPLLAAADPKKLDTLGAGMQAMLPRQEGQGTRLVYTLSPSSAAPSLAQSSTSSSSSSKSSKTPTTSQTSVVRVSLKSLLDPDFSSGCSEGERVPPASPSSSGITSTTSSPSTRPKAGTVAPRMQIKNPKHLPLMYFPAASENKKFSIQLLRSKWSSPLPLENAANGISRVTVIGEPEGSLRLFYDLSLSVGPAADRFWRTTVLTFSPRYMFTNKLSVPLLIRANGGGNEGIVLPGETVPWHWLGNPADGSKLSSEEVQIRLGMTNCDWSGPMLLETRVMTTVALLDPSSMNRYFVRIMPRLHADTGITTIIFKQEDYENPLFKIVNKTFQPLTVRQTGMQSGQFPCASDTVPPRGSRIWGWYNPMATEKGVEIMFGPNKIPKTYSLSKVMSYPSVLAKAGQLEFDVRISVSTDKSTRTLTIEPDQGAVATKKAAEEEAKRLSALSPGAQQRVNSRAATPIGTPTRSSRDPTRSSVSASTNSDAHEEYDSQQQTNDEPDWRIGLAIRSVSVSVISSEPEEILYGVVSRIATELILYPKRWTTEVQIQDIQFDNQDPMTFYPVAICAVGSSPRYWLQFSLIRSTEYPDIMCQPLVCLLMKETHVKVDEVLLLSLLDLYNARHASLLDSPSSTSSREIKFLLNNDNILSLGIDEDLSKMVYTELLLLNPIHILLSFQFSKSTTDEAREKALLEHYLLKSSNYNPGSINGIGVQRDFPALYDFLNNRISGIFTFERAPIFLSCLQVDNSFVSYNILRETILAHYTSQIGKFIASVGGSLDIAGDPISLAYNLGSGVRDLFYEPAKGIAISPLAFGQGLGRGGAQFAKKSVYGIFNTLNKGFNTIGTAAAVASFDSDYQAKRAQRKQREQQKNVAFGVGQGALELSKGLFDGITGLVLQPIQGAQKEGAAGFFKGLGKGAAGLVVKPVVGAFDLVQRTAEGIKNTALENARTQRCRWPMFIGEDGIIRLYPQRLSLAMRILHSVKSGRFAHEDFWGIFTFSTTEKTNPDALIGTYLLASTQRWVFVQTADRPRLGSSSSLDASSSSLAPSPSNLPASSNFRDTATIGISPDWSPSVDVKWHYPYDTIAKIELSFQEPGTCICIFIPKGMNGKSSISWPGTRQTLGSLSLWINERLSKHRVLTTFFQNAPK